MRAKHVGDEVALRLAFEKGADATNLLQIELMKLAPPSEALAGLVHAVVNDPLEAVVVDEGVSRDEGLERRHPRLDLRAELHRSVPSLRRTLGAMFREEFFFDFLSFSDFFVFEVKCILTPPRAKTL